MACSVVGCREFEILLVLMSKREENFSFSSIQRKNYFSQLNEWEWKSFMLCNNFNFKWIQTIFITFNAVLCAVESIILEQRKSVDENTRFNAFISLQSKYERKFSLPTSKIEVFQVFNNSLKDLFLPFAFDCDSLLRSMSWVAEFFKNSLQLRKVEFETLLCLIIQSRKMGNENCWKIFHDYKKNSDRGNFFKLKLNNLTQLKPPHKKPH